MSTEVTIAPAEGFLIDIAARIKAEHLAVAASLTRGVEHAIAAGELLLQAKKQVAHGKWLSWLGEHCSELSERSAQAYIKLARNKTEISKSAETADLTIDAALKSLAKPNFHWQRRVHPSVVYPAAAAGVTVTSVLEGRPKPKPERKPAELEAKCESGEISEEEFAKRRFLFGARRILEAGRDGLVFLQQVTLSDATELLEANEQVINQWQSIRSLILAEAPTEPEAPRDEPTRL